MYTERFEDYYETLGVSRYASVEAIRQAKRELSKKYHPDLIQDEVLKVKYGAILAKINNAADILLNPQKKYEYDLEWDAHKMKQEQESQRRRRPQYESSYTQAKTSYTYDDQARARNFYDYETNTTYTSYEQQEQRQERTSREQRRQTSSEQTRRARGYTSRHAKKEGFFEDIKQAAREVREDEKRRKTSAKRAHANVNNFVNRKFSKDRNIAEEILCAISKGTLHICVSTLRELSKLGYIAKDSFPKFVIRNRRVAAMGVAAIIMFSTLGANEPDVIIPETPSITISDSTLENDTTQQDQFIVGDNTVVSDPLEGVFQEEEQITEYVAKRYHKVVSGDTLSGLAEQAGCSIETIQRENNITGSLIKIGETLVIPYEFTSEDYKYATMEVQVPTGKTLRQIAQEYNTDVATIIRLNEDNVIQSQGNYYVITDTVRVPNFASPSQIREAREADLAYSKR